MPQLGPAEIVVIFVVALLVFGPKRLPEVGRQVGRGLRELRKLQETVRAELDEVMHAAEAAESGPAAVSAPPAYRTSGTPSLPAGTPPAPTRQRAPSRFRAPGA